SASAVSNVVAQVTAASLSLLASGSSSSTSATASPTVLAYLGDDATVDATGDVGFEASAHARAVADGLGFSAAAGISSAGAFRSSTVNPTVKAFTVGGGAISADDVSFSSRVNVDDLGNPTVPTHKGGPVAPPSAT